MTDLAPIGGMQVVQRDDNVHEPEAHITTGAGLSDKTTHDSVSRLMEFATTQGDASHLLSDVELDQLGTDIERDWRADQGSRSEWLQIVEGAIRDAAQESDDGETKNYPFENASDVRYPMLTDASLRFAARAYPALVKGDSVFGVRVNRLAPPTPDPQLLQTIQQYQQAVQSGQVQQGAPPPPEVAQAVQTLQAYQQTKADFDGLSARAQRVKTWLNYRVFYGMDDWESDTDTLLNQIPITGIGFKKVYWGVDGTRSDYVSALHLTVDNKTRSLETAARITQDFELHPYEIVEKQRRGIYREVKLDDGEDRERPRELIEQHCMCDLDDDGLPEPWIVTMDVKSKQVLRLEAAFGTQDITVDTEKNHVVAIRRVASFVEFPFFPHPNGNFYAIGFGHLLRSIVDSVDTSINQLFDAGNAQNAGGGFIASGVRLRGTGQGGVMYYQPGEYQIVDAPAGQLQNSIWEKTLPNPSPVLMDLLNVMLDAGKDIASTQDVVTGDTPSTAPVGTTLALQSSALQVFSSIYKRVYRGFRKEGRLLYECERRYADDATKAAYQEMTGGDFDQDFAGDVQDITPVADPTVVTRQQAIAKVQTVMQMAGTPVGQAAGMGSGPAAQAIMTDALEAIEVDNPGRYFGPPPAPNPLMVQETQAKVADLNAAATLKTAQAQAQGALSVERIGNAATKAHDSFVGGVKVGGDLAAQQQEAQQPQGPVQ